VWFGVRVDMGIAVMFGTFLWVWCAGKENWGIAGRTVWRGKLIGVVERKRTEIGGVGRKGSGIVVAGRSGIVVVRKGIGIDREGRFAGIVVIVGIESSVE
jgi:hypothetical protein